MNLVTMLVSQVLQLADDMSWDFSDSMLVSLNSPSKFLLIYMCTYILLVQPLWRTLMNTVLVLGMVNIISSLFIIFFSVVGHGDALVCLVSFCSVWD